jgi:hypothetical protein
MEKPKWLMSLYIAKEYHAVLFDGEKVYDLNFPTEEIQHIAVACGVILNQEQLVETCKLKMQGMKVVSSAFDGRLLAEDKNLPFSCSVASEAYWSS